MKAYPRNMVLFPLPKADTKVISQGNTSIFPSKVKCFCKNFRSFLLVKCVSNLHNYFLIVF